MSAKAQAFVCGVILAGLVLAVFTWAYAPSMPHPAAYIEKD